METQYKFLLKETAPAILVTALKEYGVTEIVGAKHNPRILEYFKTVGWKQIVDDETPWCGAFVGFAAKVSGLDVPATSIQALKWLSWGDKVEDAMLGDVLVFSRVGGGHVGIYVGQDDSCYHVLGGNQGNKVCVTRIAKSRIVGVRRTKWKIAQPKSVRKIYLSTSGVISKNES